MVRQRRGAARHARQHRPQRQPLGLVGRTGRDRPGGADREPSRLGPRRRCLRRPARRRVGVRGDRSAPGTGVRPSAAGRGRRVLRGRGRPVRPGLPGQQVLTGATAPAAARELRDGDGVTLAEAMAGAGLDPDGLGADEELLASVGAVVELHIEQGSALDGLGAAVGVAEGIWPHGRWRLDFTGRADHAGTTRLADRRDPMLPFAAAVLEARQAASAHGALATFGKVTAEPGAANAISSAVSAWLDARAPDQGALDRTVGQIEAAARRAADAQGVEAGVRRESFTPPVEFDAALRARLAAALAAQGMQAPVLPTGAGHDAGVLAARLPAAMLYVRNPTGVSHSPAEHAEPADCEAGVAALAAVLAELAG